MADRKIFFTDLDGTLLTTDKRISPGNREALLRLLAEGHPVVFSTGRALHGVSELVKSMDLYRPGCYMICFNGGLIYDIGAQQVLSSSTVSIELTARCFEVAADFGVHIQTYGGADGSTVISLRPNPYLDDYCRLQYLEHRIVPDIASSLTTPPPKMLAIDKDRAKLDHFRAEIERICDGQLEMFMSSDIYLELVPTGVNKGNAVRFLCDHLGIPVGSSVAAGDAENDLSMLEAAGIGAAMANATETVKSHADYVTVHDNDHDGVAEILERFIR